MKLSKRQQDLFEAMQHGVIVYWMGCCLDSYYFRGDTGRSCTATALALLRRELVERYAVKWDGHRLKVKTAV